MMGGALETARYIIRDATDCTCYVVEADGHHEPMLVTQDLAVALEWLAGEEI